MKQLAVLGCAIAIVGSIFAGTRPVLSSVKAERSGSYINVSYTVDKPAVITFAVMTNGVAMAWSWTASGYAGEVFQRVAAGTHAFRWKARRPGCEQFTVEPANIRVKAWAVDNPPDYVVFDMSAGFSARYYEVAEQIVGGVTNEIYKTSKLVMRKIPAACETFCMGTPQGAVGHQSNENETHVTLTNDYYLGIYELTDGQNARFTGGTSVSRVPCRASFSALRGYLDCAQWPADGHAVDAENSIILNVRTASGGLPFDLPTRAQWEFACRAGTTASLYTGEELTVAKNAADPALDDIAWYGFNSGETTATVDRHEVGLKAPNAWGLYDMLGNLWEWVLDREHNLPGGSVTEPAGHATNEIRHRCGGGYDSQPQRCRCSSASGNRPNYSNDIQAGVNGSCNANQGVRLWLPAVAER